METTIRRKITPNKIIDLFYLINIRFYEPYHDKDKNRKLNYDEKIYYRIHIRHAENEKASEVFKNGLKKIK